MLKPVMFALVASLILSSGAAATAPGPIIPKAELIAALNSVAAHGLNPADYHLATLESYGTEGEMALYAIDAWVSAR